MRISILVFTLCLLLPLAAHSSVIMVSGNCSGEWLADTVLVIGEVVVPSGYGLTIAPGVEVLFMGNYKLIVQNAAGLSAIGTEMNPIRFDWYYAGIYWHGLRFLSAADSSRLEYCIIKHAYASGADTNGGGIQINTCSPTITHCTIDSCKALYDGGGIWATTSNSTISYCTISNNFGDDDWGGIYFAYSNPTLTGNLVMSNWADDWGGGMYFYYCSYVTLTDNTITGNWCGDDAGGIGFESSNGIISHNTISNNSTGDLGGGISCYNSDPIIEYNLIIGNSSTDNGAGIWLASGSNLTIVGNVIADNTSNYNGGGIAFNSGPNLITDNEIYGNHAVRNGGGIASYYSGNTIQNNFIAGNSCGTGYNGGGIYSEHDNELVTDNVISGNSAQNGGGAYFYSSANTQFLRNDISYNSAVTSGGGAYFHTSTGFINKNTIRSNTASSGGGMYFQTSTIPITNSIVRNNTPDQLGGFPGGVTYTNIQGGWGGTGNIDADPMFATVAQPFSDLLWGSPCIDAGDPYVAYDPDGTIADMGGHYYDQSNPVRVLVTPFDAPLLIPAGGGSFNFLITVSNSTVSMQSTTIWTEIVLPGGSTYGPIIGPVMVNTSAGLNVNRLRIQAIPAYAPTGIYRYRAYAVVGADTSVSEFKFTKYGSTDDGGDWLNTGESFDNLQDASAAIMPQTTTLHSAYPNPFNPMTAISYQLSAFSHVKLSVYDISGRNVATLIDGFRDVGHHEVTFDGSGLASGLYLYRLEVSGEAPPTYKIGKMILMK
ncbi:right-handed parallel beta-helix repeat-containing protein [bacterium]|nr:right-handed parallel beta-helix repeat-containing protein [bacterium]